MLGDVPVHEVEISAGFWLGKYVVTQEQWEAVMGTTPWRDEDNADRELVQSNPSHPAVYISWNDAQELIQRLNSAAGEEVYRLPTEAEWEYACRAGTSTLWSFGNEEGAFSTLWQYDKDKVSFPHYTWYRDNTLGRNEKYAHAVGQHRPNAWGLHDMHGNVWEWVQDWYDPDYYKRSPRVDPLGPTSSPIVFTRGTCTAASCDTWRLYRSCHLLAVGEPLGPKSADARTILRWCAPCEDSLTFVRSTRRMRSAARRAVSREGDHCHECH